MQLILAIAGRISFFLFLTLAWVSTVQAGRQSSFQNTMGAGVDGAILERTVIASAVPFDPGAVITDVLITINFEKIDGGTTTGLSEASACPQEGGAGHQGGSAWNSEIYMAVRSPEGTKAVLIEDDSNTGGTGMGPTYTDADYAGPVTLQFQENATPPPDTVGGPVPVSGLFLPVQPFVFTGENPVGTWTLEFGDSALQDPLCSGTFSIAISWTADYVVGNEMTASFADMTQLGQGINTEVLSLPIVEKNDKTGTGIIPGSVVMYWYTFDLQGFPIWAFGVGTIVGDTMVVDLLIDYDGSGPFFGPGFNPDDFAGLPFATATIIWASCAQGVMTWVFDPTFFTLGFEPYTMNLTRLTNVSGLPPCI